MHRGQATTTTFHTFHDAIEKIAADNRSGAAEILRRGGEVFSLLDAQAQAQGPVSREQAFSKLLEIAAALCQAQPQMAPLVNLASAVVACASNAACAEDVSRSAREEAERFCLRAQQAATDVQSHAAALIDEGACVLTHSRSSTVEGAITNAWRAGRRFSVIATESRPMLEGRALVEALASAGVRLTLIADSAAALAMQRVSLVLLGADRVTPEHLVNKIGTRMIALAARESNVPVYAVCDTSKFLNAVQSFGSSDERRSASELWPDAPAGVEVINCYFEPAPLVYFTRIVTEEGLFAPDEAARRASVMVLHRSLLPNITG